MSFLSNRARLSLFFLGVTALLFYTFPVQAARRGAFVPPGQYVHADRELKVIFFDVGQAEAIYIKTPQHRTVLIDGGAGRMLLEDGKEIESKEVFPLLERRGIRRLDSVIISHSHPDHTSGLRQVLEKMDIGMVYDAGYHSGETEYAECMDIIRKRRIPCEKVSAGATLPLDSDLEVKVLAPPADSSLEGANNHSLVIKLTFKDVSVLFTGDAEKEEERWAARRWGPFLSAHVLKIPHHGSSTSLNLSFLKKVRPEVGIISCAMESPFGHPHTETLYRYRVLGTKIFRTDYDGDITLTTNGTTFTVETANISR